MKKIMAIAMAIVMMMAIAVPAFAAVDNGEGGSTTVIETLTTREDNSDPTWYTVTIPATQSIYWEADTTAVKYTISSQLATGDAVYVTISGSGKLTNVAGDVLSYTLVGTEYTATASVVTDEPASVTVDTSASNWTGAPVDAYSDVLTFTASIA